MYDQGLKKWLLDFIFYFQNQVMGFLMDIFSFQKTRYTLLEDLTEDLHRHLEFRLDNIAHRLLQNN